MHACLYQIEEALTMYLHTQGMVMHYILPRPALLRGSLLATATGSRLRTPFRPCCITHCSPVRTATRCDGPCVASCWIWRRNGGGSGPFRFCKFPFNPTHKGGLHGARLTAVQRNDIATAVHHAFDSRYRMPVPSAANPWGRETSLVVIMSYCRDCLIDLATASCVEA